jgi:hypothetical protein
MRSLLIALALVAGCATHRPPPLPVPAAEPGRITAAARAVPPAGGVQPVAVALTNGGPEPLSVDRRQVYALDEREARFAPLPPAEAARQAGGKRLPGAVRRGAVGAATGGVFGALGGVIAGAIQGGIGAAVAVGSAVGAAVGAVAGVLGGGGESAPDVAGFEDRALHATTLAPGLSTEGYVYYPTGRYTMLELVFASKEGGEARRERVPIEPAR